MIQYQILRTKIIRIVWQAVRRITNDLLGVKGLASYTLSVEKQSHFKDIVVILEKFSSFRFNACSEAFTMIGGEH